MSDWKIKHKPCEKCGSSDAASMNHDNWWTCFSCGERWPDGGEYIDLTDEREQGVVTMQTHGCYKSYEYIPVEVCKKFGIRTDAKDIYFEYRDENGNICAQKKRIDGNKNQTFTEGAWGEGKLFGQHLWDTGGKYIIITEGEKDAASVYAMDKRYKVVSIRNGAKAALKDCKKEFKFLDSFENVVICFDADEAGQKAAKEVAALFPAKSKIMKMPTGCKDAHDVFKFGNAEEFRQAFWGASEYLPEGIVNGSTLWDRLNKPAQKPLIHYPWDGLNRITHGIRAGELVTCSAGSGVGKSQLVREVMYHCLTNTTDNIGAIFLEESIEKTAQSMMSLHLSKPLHLPTVTSTEEERKKAFDATVGRGQVYFYELFGSTSVENIVGQVRYLAKAHDCKYVFLDHLSIIVSSQENGDERKAIDEVMTRLRTLVQDTGIALIMISHLRRPEGKAHEEGARTSLGQLRGSASIAQLSDIVLGFERDGQAETEEQRNTTKIRVLKNRFSGETGEACNLFYDKDTNRLTEVYLNEDVL
jgi:twinkle protein